MTGPIACAWVQESLRKAAVSRHTPAPAAAMPAVRQRAGVPVPIARAPCSCGGGCPTCRAGGSSLRISQPQDAAEREAEQIAGAIMRAPDNTAAVRPDIRTDMRDASALQRDEEEPPPGTPIADPRLVLPDLFDPRLDWFEMSRPFTTRGADLLTFGDTRTHLAVGNLWRNNYRFFFDFGLSDKLSADAANFFTPFALDSALKRDFATPGEMFERNADISSLIISPTVFTFDLGDIPGTLRSPLSFIFGGSKDNPYRKKPRHTLGRKADVFAAPAWQAQDVDRQVDGTLAATGSALPSTALDFFNTRFGRDFSSVRIHAGSEAAASARAVQAKAYTVGHDIVFGAGRYDPHGSEGRHLLAHELTHVVQQAAVPALGEASAPASVQSAAGVLHRTADPSDDPAGSVRAPTPQLVSGGLPEPDCSLPASTYYSVRGIIKSNDPACSTAQIQDKRNQDSLPDFYRADHNLSGQDPCPGFPGVPDARVWLGNQWRIVEMDDSTVTVVNLCGDEERLAIQGGCECPPPEQTLPERRVSVKESNFGEGTVTIHDGCNRAVFLPTDCCRPRIEFNRTVDDSGFEYWTSEQFMDGVKPRMYAPSDVSRMLRVSVLTGSCGDRYEAELPPEPDISRGAWEGF